MSESCSTCRFSASANEKVPGTLECRRRPPVGYAFREPAAFPRVFPESWCGEFESKPASAPKPRAKRPVAGEQETRGEQG